MSIHVSLLLYVNINFSKEEDVPETLLNWLELQTSENRARTTIIQICFQKENFGRFLWNILTPPEIFFWKFSSLLGVHLQKQKYHSSNIWSTVLLNNQLVEELSGTKGDGLKRRVALWVQICAWIVRKFRSNTHFLPKPSLCKRIYHITFLIHQGEKENNFQTNSILKPSQIKILVILNFKQFYAIVFCSYKMESGAPVRVIS